MPARDLFHWIGHVVDGKLRVEDVIAEGGFAVVYRARHMGFDTTVALKCLKVPGHLGEHERAAFLRAFVDEGKLLHRLSRANTGIVQALDVGAAVSPNGSWTPYLALEWLDGVSLEEDLATRAAAGAPPRVLHEVLDLLASAAHAIDAAHRHGVAHRDIKPANLFLANVEGRRVVKVVDFGIAKVMADATTTSRALRETATAAGAGVGLPPFSPQYGAPEQFDRGVGATGPWTDVFAFALVVVELLTGRPALDGDDPMQLFVASMRPERPTPRARGRDPGDPVEAVLARALAVEPSARYPRLGEMWSALVEAERKTRPRAHGPRSREAWRAWVGATAIVGALGLTSGGVYLAAREDAVAPPSRTHVTGAPVEAPRAVAEPPLVDPPAAEPPLADGTIRASHILVTYAGATDATSTRTVDEARARAAEARARLARGEDFATVAAEYGEDATRTRGGDLGTFRRGRFPRAFTDAAFALAPGDVSDVVQTRFGFHIVKRTR